MPKTVTKVFVMMLLALGMLLSPKGYIEQYFLSPIMSPVTTSNDLYLTESFNQALAGFLVLSGIKSGLAVIEGSEVGIGFNLELGDIVQSVYDYVDIAWKTVLTGAVVIYFTRLFIRAIELIDQVFLTGVFAVFLAMMIVYWYFPGYPKIFYYLREAALLLLLVTLSLYLLLPLTIKGTAYISKMVSLPLIEEAQHNFSDIEHIFSMEEMKESLFPVEAEPTESWLSKLDVSKNMQQIKDRFEHLKKQIAEKSAQVAAWTIKLIVGYLFDCILFPIVFVAMYILLVKMIFSVLFRYNRNRMIKDDLDTSGLTQA